MTPLKLIVGLKNPGQEYAHTRHNAGFWLIEALLRATQSTLKEEKKLQGSLATVTFMQHPVLLFTPAAYMNTSGLSIQRIAGYFKLASAEILIAHDELDLPPGVAKFKTGGGHGGHNGLRDIIQHLGTPQFHRLRLGIGHPQDKTKVHQYVLSAPSKHDAQLIQQAIAQAMASLPLALQGDWPRAMQHLHTLPNEES